MEPTNEPAADVEQAVSDLENAENNGKALLAKIAGRAQEVVDRHSGNTQPMATVSDLHTALLDILNMCKEV
jgi:hypothetical protein